MNPRKLRRLLRKNSDAAAVLGEIVLVGGELRLHRSAIRVYRAVLGGLDYEYDQNGKRSRVYRGVTLGSVSSSGISLLLDRGVITEHLNPLPDDVKLLTPNAWSNVILRTTPMGYAVGKQMALHIGLDI